MGERRPILLDLFCGAGGATRGYQLAGFHVTGVDNRPQTRYIGEEFVQADALEYCREHGHEFDAIHASPPCQAYSEATPLEIRKRMPDLIGATREALVETKKPYVIENVENARKHLINPIMLCGTMFGLRLWRHRYFEITPMWFLSPTRCDHSIPPCVPHAGSYTRANRGTGMDNVKAIREAMQIEWMTRDELYEAIPPAYTEFIGRELLRAVRGDAETTEDER